MRLARLAKSPVETRLLRSLIVREIICRLLLGEQGARLRHLATVEGEALQIVQAIRRLQTDFDKPLRISELVREVGMSVSAFHHRFKAVTAMSPLQFRKQLRLQEARRLMLVEHVDATGVAYRVGYRDAAHFNREYKSVFGAPPMRDVQAVRAEANPAAGGLGPGHRVERTGFPCRG